MNEYGLDSKKLFQLKRKTLEKRILQFYRETTDGNSAIEMLVALQVREELCEEDFSFMLAELVQHIFLRMRSNTTLRRFYGYFSEYFDKKEWRLLTLKLFPVKSYVTEKFKSLYTQFIAAPMAALAGS